MAPRGESGAGAAVEVAEVAASLAKGAAPSPAPALAAAPAAPVAKASHHQHRQLLGRETAASGAAAPLPAPAAQAAGVPTKAPKSPGSAPKATPDQRPAHDVVAGAMARAASQGTIHPLDTMKVRMQAPRATRASPADPAPAASGPQGMGGAGRGAGASASTPSRRPPSSSSLAAPTRRLGATTRRRLGEVRGLYRGVVGAAAGAGLIIGAYFAFYSTTKRFLRRRTSMSDGAVAFAAGATAALGSSVVKVPLAVCVRSVQAGVYPNAAVAAREIVRSAGPRGLMTGFLPTVLEDVPDMAVKFAAYETMRNVHSRLLGRAPSSLEDLAIGGIAGAAAAAATTPLDVVKTVMMCSASARPSALAAALAPHGPGGGAAPFFRGVGPRALSNGLNSAIFFCFFEAIRQVLIKRQQQAARLSSLSAPPRADLALGGSREPASLSCASARADVAAHLETASMEAAATLASLSVAEGRRRAGRRERCRVGLAASTAAPFASLATAWASLAFPASEGSAPLLA